MANQDTTPYLGNTATLEIHVPAGQISPEGADAGFVDFTQAGVTVLGVPVVATKVTIAGNVRFMNPA